MTRDPRLPNFFILGAAKCGTTSLYYYLKQHPEIYLPEDKEPHFFDNNTFWNEGLETYLKRHFKGAERYPARGEATPGYFHRWAKVIPRMKEVYGDESPKFIIVFRDPVRRAWSHYLHMVRNRLEHEPFEKALEMEEMRRRENPNKWYGYYTDGLYASHLEHWLEHFPDDRFLFFLTEDLRTSPKEVVQEICRFLNINPEIPIDISFRANPAAEPRWDWLMRFLSRPSKLKLPFKKLLGPYTRKWLNERLRRAMLKPIAKVPQVDPEIEALLRKKYAKDIRRLEKLIGRDLSHWLHKANANR